MHYKSMKRLVKEGVNIVYEVGHGQVLSGLAKRDFKGRLEVFSAQKLLETA